MPSGGVRLSRTRYARRAAHRIFDKSEALGVNLKVLEKLQHCLRQGCQLVIIADGSDRDVIASVVDGELQTGQLGVVCLFRNGVLEQITQQPTQGGIAGCDIQQRPRYTNAFNQTILRADDTPGLTTSARQTDWHGGSRTDRPSCAKVWTAHCLAEAMESGRSRCPPSCPRSDLPG